MTLQWNNPYPQDPHDRIATFGGAIMGWMATIQWQNIFSTIIVSCVGTIVSFYVSRYLQNKYPKHN